MSEFSRLDQLPTLQVNSVDVEHFVNFEYFVEGVRTISGVSDWLPLITTVPMVIGVLGFSDVCTGCQEMQNAVYEAQRRGGVVLVATCTPSVIDSNGGEIRTGVMIQLESNDVESSGLTSESGPCALAQDISGLPEISYKSFSNED